MMSSFIRKFILGEWNLGFSNQDFLAQFAQVKQGGTLKLDVRWMKHHHHNSFYADPFVYKVNDNCILVLAEEYFYDRKKGVISLLTLRRDSGQLIDKRIILEESCHLSYPFYDSNFNSFIPESFRNGNWTEYSFDGEKVLGWQTITDYPLIDATPVLYCGKWFVFATIQPNALDELLIFWSDNREGPYTPHLLNPVKKDIKTSRCGGRFFEYNGKLFRPVQDSTNRYGETMHIMRVKELSPISFREEHYCDVVINNPGKYSLGFHTLNFKDGVVIVDGFREAFRPLRAAYSIKVSPLLFRLLNKQD